MFDDCPGARAEPSGGPGPGGAGLLAHVLVSKYAYHLPFYRQAEIYSNLGVELERSMFDGVRRVPIGRFRKFRRRSVKYEVAIRTSAS